MIKIIKKPDDPICPRVSMGGNPVTGFYVVYRGSIADILKVFEECHAAIKQQALQGEPPVEDN